MDASEYFQKKLFFFFFLKFRNLRKSPYLGDFSALCSICGSYSAVAGLAWKFQGSCIQMSNGQVGKLGPSFSM